MTERIVGVSISGVGNAGLEVSRFRYRGLGASAPGPDILKAGDRHKTGISLILDKAVIGDRNIPPRAAVILDAGDRIYRWPEPDTNREGDMPASVVEVEPGDEAIGIPVLVTLKDPLQMSVAHGFRKIRGVTTAMTAISISSSAQSTGTEIVSFSTPAITTMPMMRAAAIRMKSIVCLRT